MKLRERKCFVGKVMMKKKKFVKVGFLKKSDDEKGRVFELLFSDELYNFVRRSGKGKYF